MKWHFTHYKGSPLAAYATKGKHAFKLPLFIYFLLTWFEFEHINWSSALWLCGTQPKLAADCCEGGISVQPSTSCDAIPPWMKLWSAFLSRLPIRVSGSKGVTTPWTSYLLQQGLCGKTAGVLILTCAPSGRSWGIFESFLCLRVLV